MMLCEKIKEEQLSSLNGNYKANIKFDGERIMAIVKDGEVTLINRRGRIKNSHYEEVVEELKHFENCILDGEVISYDDDFTKLQRRALTTDKFKQQQLRKEIPVRYMVFDIIESYGKDLTNETLKDRVLEILGVGVYNETIEKAVYGNVIEMLAQAKNQNREGIVIKNMDSKYEKRRSKNWLKLKFFKEINLKLNDYTINNAGIRATDPIGNVVQISGNQHKEVKQEIDEKGSCEAIVQYLEKTKDGRLRFPSYVGTTKEIAREESIKLDEWE